MTVPRSPTTRPVALAHPVVVALVAAVVLWSSPVRWLRGLPSMDERSPFEVAVEVERDQPVGA